MFEHLYRAYVGRIHAICLRLTADARRAEDLTQTAFVQAWQKLPAFRGESGLGSWLHRIAVNVVLMDMRGRKRREAIQESIPDVEALDAAAPRASPGMRMDLEQAIAGLPTQGRTIFVLHEIEGYTHEEIARLMNLQEGTTKAQLHRARKLLQQTLQ